MREEKSTENKESYSNILRRYTNTTNFEKIGDRTLFQWYYAAEGENNTQDYDHTKTNSVKAYSNLLTARKFRFEHSDVET